MSSKSWTSHTVLTLKGQREAHTPRVAEEGGSLASCECAGSECAHCSVQGKASVLLFCVICKVRHLRLLATIAINNCKRQKNYSWCIRHLMG